MISDRQTSAHRIKVESRGADGAPRHRRGMAALAIVLGASAASAQYPEKLGRTVNTGTAEAQTESGIHNYQGFDSAPSPGTASASSSDGYGADSAASEGRLSHNGTLKASAQSTGFGGFARSSSTISYDFQLVGPDNPAGVPFTISAVGGLEGNGPSDPSFGGYGADLRFAVFSNSDELGILDPISQMASIGNAPGSQSSISFSFTKTVMLPTNVNISVFLLVDAEAAAGKDMTCLSKGCDVSASVFLDPTFMIGDGYSDYTLKANFPIELGSASSAVPETATWGYLISGLALIGCTQRARRSRSRKMQPSR